MKLKPLSDRVVLKKAEKELKTKSGLILSSAAAEDPSYYEVVAVGPGLFTDGVRVPMDVQVGDKVFVDKFSGTTVKVDGEEFFIVHQNEIMAVIG